MATAHEGPHSHARKMIPKKGIDVSFDSFIQIAIGLEDDISFSTIWCTHQQLRSWDTKPWRMDPPTTAHSHERVHAGNHMEAALRISRALNDLFPWNRPRDLPHDAPPWMQRTFRFFFMDYAMEYEDQQPEVVLQTWFLQEAQHRICTKPRMIALDMEFFKWKRQLLRLWEDLVEPGSDPQFFIVNPDPMRTSMQSFHAHLIIVQNRRLEGPILTTMLWHGQHHDFLFQRALFVPTELHLEVLQRKLDVANHCQAAHCTWWKGPQRILDDFLPRVLPGEGIQLVLHDPDQPDREDARFPTVEWPYVEPPPPHVDPEELFLHEDDQQDEELLLTQLQTSLQPQKPGEQSVLERQADPLFDDKENCDPALVRKDALTSSPTSTQKRHFEDGTRPPLRTALSSLNFATTQSSKQTAVGDLPNVADPIHSFVDLGTDGIPVEQTRLLPEIDLPPIRASPPEEQPVPQRPDAIWTYPTWIQELWMTLHRYGTVEREEEGPTIQVVTWHIHQETHRRCYRPRVLRLNDICDTWEQQIRHL